MIINTTQLLLGFFLALSISLLAWRFNFLSISGAYAASLLGTVVFGIGGLAWAVLLIVFFISSSLLSITRKSLKTSLNEKFSKGSKRDAQQVLANGGIAGLFVLLDMMFPSQVFHWLGFAGALAAVNADTWATELGVLSKQTPRLISSWEYVEKGESGGITLAGSFSAFAGAIVIAIPAIFITNNPFYQGFSINPFLMVSMIALAGLGGSMLDSYLGATLQASYWCSDCNKKTEQSPIHSCGNPVSHVSGKIWMTNDLVNAFCSLAGALLCITLFFLIA